MSPARSSNTGWSSERKLWTELEQLSNGLLWKKVIFEPDREHLLPDSDRGVYLICATPPIESLSVVSAYTILYAGRVKSSHRSLRDRFLEHIRRPSAKLKIFVDCYYPTLHFWYATEERQSRIDALEILLIETFRPPCNSIRAPGTRAFLARLGSGQIIGTTKKFDPHRSNPCESTRQSERKWETGSTI